MNTPGFLMKLLWVLAQLFVWVARALLAATPHKIASVCLRHRLNARERYFERAFRSGKDVLLVSIMSESTLTEFPKYVAAAKESGTRLRILTLDPASHPEVIEAIRRHLGENPDSPRRTQEQVSRAREDWMNIARAPESAQVIEVRTYRSTPTMQGVIVGTDWALLELLPFSTLPTDRPALILKEWQDKALFQVFQKSFESLWDDADKLT